MHEDQPRRVDRPEPGFFRTRLVARGWAVPARIERNDEGLWRVTIDGTAKEWVRDPTSDEALARVWHFGEAVEEWVYRDLLDLKIRMAEAHPDHPCLAPHRPIKAMTMPVVRGDEIATGIRLRRVGAR